MTGFLRHSCAWKGGSAAVRIPSPTAQIAEVVRTLIPHIGRAGLATAAEIDIDTLEERLRSEVISAGAIIVAPPFVGAWAYKP